MMVPSVPNICICTCSIHYCNCKSIYKVPSVIIFTDKFISVYISTVSIRMAVRILFCAYNNIMFWLVDFCAMTCLHVYTLSYRCFEVEHFEKGLHCAIYRTALITFIIKKVRDRQVHSLNSS